MFVCNQILIYIPKEKYFVSGMLNRQGISQKATLLMQRTIAVILTIQLEVLGVIQQILTHDGNTVTSHSVLVLHSIYCTNQR